MVAGIVGAQVACSSDESPAATPDPDSSSSSTSSTSSSSGENGPKPGSSSGEPNETVKCDLATETVSCTIEAFIGTEVSLTTDASCKTTLYAAGHTSEESFDTVIRRYTLKSLKPCVFERDMAFKESQVGDVIAADDAGDFLSVASKVVELIKGETRITCDGALPTDASTPVAVLARDGSVGYLGHLAYDAGGSLTKATLSKITITGDTCAVAPFETQGDKLTGINGLALDTKGRLHVSDTANKPPGADRVDIFNPDGSLAKTYKLGDPQILFKPQSITACRGGICVDGQQDVVAFDENGIPRSHNELHGIEEFYGLVKFVGTPRGPFFLVGNFGDQHPKLAIDTMKQPQ